VPLCRQHEVPAVSFVSKKATSQGKRFWVCGLDKDHKCKFFVWDSDISKTPGLKLKKLGAVSSSSSSSSASSGLLPSSLGCSVFLTCELVAENVLEFDFAPHSGALATLFKSLKGVYSTQSRKWRFPLAQYEQVVEAARAEGKKNDVPFSLNTDFTPQTILEHFAKTSKLKDEISLEDNPALDPKNTLPSSLWNRLMGFQKEGVQFVVRHQGRAYIGDEMGLGKTIQALASMLYYRTDWPVLIVCPSSLRLVWMVRELLLICCLLLCQRM